MLKNKYGKSLLLIFLSIFMLLVLACLGSNLYQYKQIEQGTKAIETLYHSHLQSIQYLGLTKTNLLQLENHFDTILKQESPPQGLATDIKRELQYALTHLEIAKSRTDNPKSNTVVFNTINFIKELQNTQFSALNAPSLSNFIKRLEQQQVVLDELIETESTRAYEYLVAQRMTQHSVLFILKFGIFLFIGLLIALPIFAYFRIVGPLRKLAKMVEAYGRREISHDEINLDYKISEFNYLAKTFKRMGFTIEQYQKNMLADSEKHTEFVKRASMYNLASEMLHNIGNALNSTKTSVNIIQDLANKRSMSQRLLNICESEDQFNAILSEDSSVLRNYLMKLALASKGESIIIENETQVMKNSLDHIEHLVQLSRTNNKVIDIIEQVNINELLEQAISMVQPKFDNKLNFKLNFSSLPLIQISKQNIMQVFLNILTNAAYATTEVNQVITNLPILVGTEVDDGNIIIKFQDRGVGISKDKLDIIFHQGFTTKKEGQGIGLHNCANILKKYHGEIKVESQGPNTGATFYVVLPLERIADIKDIV